MAAVISTAGSSWGLAKAKAQPRVLAIGAVAAVLLVGGWLALRGRGTAEPIPGGGQFFTVVPMDMDITIVKDGEVQAVNNTDIGCHVEGQNTITYLVPEGASVKKNDVLIMLDSATIKQKLEDASLDLQKGEADLTAAKEMKDIQESQNAANLDAAKVALQLAKLDLQQYVEGTWPQSLENAKTTVEMARITLRNKEEDLGETRQLYDKGFVTGADVKKAELDVTTARNDLQKQQTALDVLQKYTNQMDLASKRNALVDAEQKLVRVQRENASNLAQKVADAQAKEQSLAIIRRRHDHLQEQVENCTIKAPENGLVLYASSVDRSVRDPIQEGATVRERQLLLRLPDVRSMKAVVRIQESQVPRLNVAAKMRGKVKIVGIAQPIGATLSRVSVLPDNSQRWWNPDLKEYPVELTLDYTPPDLRPGVGMQAEIMVDRLEQTLAVPVAAIYTTGKDSYAFVRDSGAARPAKVTLGDNSDTHVQITSGLQSGDQVLLLSAGQGRSLLAKAGISVEPTTKPSNGKKDDKVKPVMPPPPAAPEAAPAAAKPAEKPAA